MPRSSIPSLRRLIRTLRDNRGNGAQPTVQAVHDCHARIPRDNLRGMGHLCAPAQRTKKTIEEWKSDTSMPRQTAVSRCPATAATPLTFPPALARRIAPDAALPRRWVPCSTPGGRPSRRSAGTPTGKPECRFGAPGPGVRHARFGLTRNSRRKTPCLRPPPTAAQPDLPATRFFPPGRTGSPRSRCLPCWSVPACRRAPRSASW